MATDPNADLSELPHWEDEPDIWDTVHLGDMTLPGIATLTIERGRKADKKAAKGKQKATVTVQGYEAADVKITLRLLSREDLRALNELLPRIEPIPDKGTATEADAYDLAHPVAAMRGVNSILVLKIDGPTLQDGIMSITFTCIEFEAPKKAGVGSGKGGGAAGTAAGAYNLIGAFYDGVGNLIDNKSLQARLIVGDLTQGSTFEERPGKYSLDGGKTFNEGRGYFIGAFVLEDPFAKAQVEGELKDKGKTLDATKTPDTSQGGDGSENGQGDLVPDPADEDPWA
jgi:hypothetical protein